MFFLEKHILKKKVGIKLKKTFFCSHELEYGNNSLAIQIDSIKPYNSFAIVDDLLATGGTVKCVSEILTDFGKEISGLSVVVELEKLNGRNKFKFPVESNLIL